MTTIQTAETSSARVGGKYLSFLLAGEHYAVAIESVRQIIVLPEITPLPDLPPFVEGVMNLRGQILPVVDLRGRLGLASGAHGDDACVVVMDLTSPSGDAHQVGCIVESVDEILELSADQIEPAPFSGQSRTSTLSGLAKFEDHGKVVSLLDMNETLADVLAISVSG